MNTLYRCPASESGHDYQFTEENPPGGNVVSKCRHCGQRLPGSPANGVPPVLCEPALPTVALSIRQPWAWLILHAGKDIENRNWRTKFRGRVLLHASNTCTLKDWDAARVCYENLMIDGEITTEAGAIPHRLDLERGGIVGVAEIVDCVTDSDSEWFFGDYGFVLKNAQPIDFIPCKGALGFFKPNL